MIPYFSDESSDAARLQDWHTAQAYLFAVWKQRATFRQKCWYVLTGDWA